MRRHRQSRLAGLLRGGAPPSASGFPGCCSTCCRPGLAAGGSAHAALLAWQSRLAFVLQSPITPAYLVRNPSGFIFATRARSVSRAYERTSLVVTTNLPFEAWPEVCGSERLTGAILNRLTHRVHIL